MENKGMDALKVDIFIVQGNGFINNKINMTVYCVHCYKEYKPFANYLLTKEGRGLS